METRKEVSFEWTETQGTSVSPPGSSTFWYVSGMAVSRNCQGRCQIHVHFENQQGNMAPLVGALECLQDLGLIGETKDNHEWITIQFVANGELREQAPMLMREVLVALGIMRGHNAARNGLVPLLRRFKIVRKVFIYHNDNWVSEDNYVLHTHPALK